MKSAKGKGLWCFSNLVKYMPEFWRVSLALLLFLLSSWFSIAAQNFPEKPTPPRLVNDYAGILNASERNALEDKLVAYDDSTSTQIAVVIQNNIGGADIGQYSIDLFNKWGIGGNAKKDNGVLISISIEERKIFIVTGRGVEEYLPDAICKRIITNRIVPNFKRGNYYNGLNEATDEMIARLSGTFVNDEQPAAEGIPLWVIIVIIVIVFFVLPAIFRGGGGTYSGRGYTRGWGSGPFIGGGFGGGGRSFGGGGGFGGFGGGSSGGGGAGGSW